MNTRLFRDSVCPICGNALKNLPILKSLSRSYLVNCTSCGSKLISDIGWGWYLLISLYSQIILFALALPLIFGLIAGSWITVGIALLAFFTLTLTPAAVVHAHFLKPEIESPQNGSI